MKISFSEDDSWENGVGGALAGVFMMPAILAVFGLEGLPTWLGLGLIPGTFLFFRHVVIVTNVSEKRETQE